MGKRSPSRLGNTGTYTFSLYDSDDELIEWMRSKLGGSRSDVVRTALRAYGMHLSLLHKEPK